MLIVTSRPLNADDRGYIADVMLQENAAATVSSRSWLDY
jgi:hypothetical protein